MTYRTSRITAEVLLLSLISFSAISSRMVVLLTAANAEETNSRYPKFSVFPGLALNNSLIETAAQARPLDNYIHYVSIHLLSRLAVSCLLFEAFRK